MAADVKMDGDAVEAISEAQASASCRLKAASGPP